MERKIEKRADIAIETIIVLILAILVIFVVLFFIFNPYIFNWLRNLPGYGFNDTDVLITNFTQDELAIMGCSKIVGKISSKERKLAVYEMRQISVGDIETEIYFVRGDKSSSSPDLIMIPKSKVSYWGSLDVLNFEKYWLTIGKVGLVSRKIEINLDFLEEDSSSYLKYKDYLPNVNLLKVLHGSQLFMGDNFLCKTKEDIDIYRESKKCIENCALFNGICKKINECVEGEISYGELDCGLEKTCCVKEAEEKLKDGELVLGHFEFFWPVGSYRTNLKEGELSVEVPVSVANLFIGGASYAKADKPAFSTPFCYLVRTNKQVIFKEFLGEFGGRGLTPIPYTGMSGYNIPWIPGDEKTFELIAWVPGENKKVFKRVKIILKTGEEFKEKINSVPDNEFENNVDRLKEGGSFYVFFPRGYTFSQKEIYVEKFWIKGEKGDRAVICAYTKGNPSIGLNRGWYMMDCYTGFLGGFGTRLSLGNVEKSFTETMQKNCKWKNSVCPY